MYVVHENKDRLKPYREGNLQSRLGTGFFVDESTIVTNQHVVEGAHSIKVEGVFSREKFSVKLAAVPSLKFDLAILEFVDPATRERYERLNGRVEPLNWAAWEETHPGEKVSVLGFGNSEKLAATQGIISSWEARHDVYQRRLDQVILIRTDAAVNPGNSGGPVVSPAGRVVGISARYGAGENIGLLIPFITAKQVVEAMVTAGEFLDADPGIIAYPLNPVIRTALGLTEDQTGLVVSHAVPGSPAARAGLRQWDVLTAINGYPIKHGEIHHEHAGRVPYWFLFNAAATDTVLTFDVLRRDTKPPVTVTMRLLPTRMPRIWLPTEGDDYRPEWGFLGGLTITEVTQELLEEVEEGGNWRWDLVNDAPRLGKIYMIANVEPDTQAMTYQDYGVDLTHLRVLAVNGKPLNGDLTQRLREIYESVEDGTLSQTITLDLEKHISIQLDRARLHTDLQALHTRYPGIGLIASEKRPGGARGSRNDRGQVASQPWMSPTKGGNAHDGENMARRNGRPASGLPNPAGERPTASLPVRTNC